MATEPTDEQLMVWIAGGKQPITESHSWYCRVATDGKITVYGGFCTMSMASKPYENVPKAIAETPFLYLILFMAVVLVMQIRKAASPRGANEDKENL